MENRRVRNVKVNRVTRTFVHNLAENVLPSPEGFGGTVPASISKLMFAL